MLMRSGWFARTVVAVAVTAGLGVTAHAEEAVLKSTLR